MNEKPERPKVTDAVSFVVDVVRSAYWDVVYHERALKPEHNKLKWARELVQRLDIDPDVERAERDEDDEPIGHENLSQFVMDIVDDLESSIEHHESALRWGHNRFAFATAMLARGNYNIDIEAIKRQVEGELR